MPGVQRPPPGGSVSVARLDGKAPLLTEEQIARAKRQWKEITAGFRRAPERALEEADFLMADLVRQIALRFSRERSLLESHRNGQEVPVEDFKAALHRYRLFFRRLLSA